MPNAVKRHCKQRQVYNPVMLRRYIFCIVLIAGISILFGCKTEAQGMTLPPSSAFIHGLAVTINDGALLQFGLDTGGAADFFINPSRAQQLRLPVVGHRLIHTSDKQAIASGIPANIVQATTLTVAGHVFIAPEGVVLPDTQHDGTLGIELFRDVLLTLDYPHDRLSIATGELPPPNISDIVPYTTSPNAAFRPLRVAPTVKIQLAGRNLTALLDTGARSLNADVMVPTQIAATLPLGPNQSETLVEDAAGHFSSSHTATLKGDMVLGNIVLHNPVILISGGLGFIDLARITGRLVITIDQRNHRLRLAMPIVAPTSVQ